MPPRMLLLPKSSSSDTPLCCIWCHRFFAAIDFDALVAGTIKPPWVPKLKNARDCLALHVKHS